jgi:hypothetical protein
LLARVVIVESREAGSAFQQFSSRILITADGYYDVSKFNDKMSFH